FHLHPVKLCRIRIGPVDLGALKPGESRPLSGSEYTGLMRSPAAGEVGAVLGEERRTSLRSYC
ncbi:MAG: hypothetical protein LBL76_05290, partial [Treponema sp.]|nr:hypothetical protein [Treponema sp.]